MEIGKASLVKRISFFKKKAPQPETTFAVDAQVPLFTSWPKQGIVGTIGNGPSTGGIVAAFTEHDATGEPCGYVLELPVDHLYDSTGNQVMDDLASDTRLPDGKVGSLIDALTREVKVSWWSNEKDINAYFEEH